MNFALLALFRPSHAVADVSFSDGIQGISQGFVDTDRRAFSIHMNNTYKQSMGSEMRLISILCSSFSNTTFARTVCVEESSSRE